MLGGTLVQQIEYFIDEETATFNTVYNRLDVIY